MKITVKPEENREFAYTDKESAYFYGRTHSNGSDWFSGWNVNTERIFQDYLIQVDGQVLDRKEAGVEVYPHFLKRNYKDLEETFQMFDDQRVLSIELSRVKGEKIALALYGARLKLARVDQNVAFYRLPDLPGYLIGMATIKGGAIWQRRQGEDVFIESDRDQGGFFIVLNSNETGVCSLLEQARSNHKTWAAAREQRMETLLRKNLFRTSTHDLDLAISWNILSLDALVTKQTGNGIYAGLPWFNDYWGRDMFITLPGACLVTGELEVARKILLSFASYQNKDENSSYFGRVPNRVRPNEIIYNTTDGTPRFVVALFQYIKYSGDTSLISELYPVVRRSIEGPLKYCVDKKGYLTHEDADTWMDARKDGKEPFSPRGNRANDIQALWFEQLQAGIYFARYIKNRGDEERWTEVAERLRSNFVGDFLDPAKDSMADRLTKEGQADFTFRPNQLFALDLVTNRNEKLRLTRKVWETLVYPWGVASLSQSDPNFHPWHEYWEFYHKDEAYHNGTVWLWNNGIAIERMLEGGQKELAYQLFQNMSNQALHAGAVGCLSELTDALPRVGCEWPRLSGTFSQAWSMAEYLRVWYQFFVGIRPDATEQKLILEPRFPESISNLDFNIPLFDGTIAGAFNRAEKSEKYAYSFDRLRSVLTVNFKLPLFAPVSVRISSGDSLSATVSNGKLQMELRDPSGKVRWSSNFEKNPAELAARRIEDQIFSGVTFAKPLLNRNLKALKK